jgi:hypothetical protein
MVLVIEGVHALVDREGDERGAIGRGERTGGEDPAQGIPDLGEGLVGGETTGVRLAAETGRHVRQLLGNAAALEVTPHGRTKEGARFSGERRQGGERCYGLFSGVELLGQDGDPRILAMAVGAAT